jgi:hypothetical protein
LAGTALSGVGNDVVNQGFTKGWGNINFGQTAMSGLMSMATSYLGSNLGGKVAPAFKTITENISSPVLKQTIRESLTSATVGFTLTHRYGY